VRLLDPAGQPLGYAGRRLDKQAVARYGKWKLARGLPKRHLLYGFHHAAGQHHGLAVVECPWGVMRLAQLRIPAVALLGTQLSPAQHQLVRQYPRVLLMLDGDPAGRDATARLFHRLRHFVDTQCVYLPAGHDPDDLDDSALAALVRPVLL